MKIRIKKSHRGKLTDLKKRTGKTEAELYRTGSPAVRKMITFARNARKWKHGDGGELNTYDAGELPEITVTGYAPLRLTTYYPITSKYPYTGHSKLDIPIDRQTWYDYVGEMPSSDRVSPYVTIDKTSTAEDYNLVTNNCADATLEYLNGAFGTSESPWLFTTPGDVRDYALNKLSGKLIENSDGSDTVLIPRNAKIANKLSETALNMFNNDQNGTAHAYYKGRFRTKQYKKQKHGLGGNLYPGGGFIGLMPAMSGIAIDSNAAENIATTASKKVMNYIKGAHDTGSYFSYDPSMEAYTGPAQDTYLLPRKLQEKEFLRRGYIKGKDKDYGLVKRAVGDRNLPVYQRNPDAITRDNLTVIGNIHGWDPWYGSADTALEHPGSYPTAVYTDTEGNFFQKGWDLNDYGGKTGSTIGFLSDIVDRIGSPTVVTTGYQPVSNPQDKNFIQAITPMMANKGLVPTEINGKTEWVLPEVTVTGKKRKK